MHPILEQTVFYCTKCGARMGACDCWDKYTARLVQTETGWEARLDRPDGTAPIVWPYKRRHAAQRKVKEWQSKGYEVKETQ